jgi:hypothetical protein
LIPQQFPSWQTPSLHKSEQRKGAVTFWLHVLLQCPGDAPEMSGLKLVALLIDLLRCLLLLLLSHS